MTVEERPLWLHDYDYELPQERIAQFPLQDRTASKLLHYHGGSISHQQFREIAGLLPAGSTLYFNNTKVIPARLILQKESGARIEVFLLEPVGLDIAQAMEQGSGQTWRAMVGNKKKWKDGQQVNFQVDGLSLSADWTNREQDELKLQWTGSRSLVDLLEELGKIPLPPYLQREAEEQDKNSYQTVYAKQSGAVAAPTAGLHFTPELMQQLKTRGHQQRELTLHVGAGTFKPVAVEDIRQHPMHAEELLLEKASLLQMAEAKGKSIAVGTTSMRSLESYYWLGVKASKGEDSRFLEQDYPYSHASELSLSEALEALAAKIGHGGRATAKSALMIRPGYRFRVVNGLITNFHMPKSTLLVLIDAFVGPAWKEIYQEALRHNYRFLSYGDSSLLLP